MDDNNLVNLLSGSWRASYNYGVDDASSLRDTDTSCTVQMYAHVQSINNDNPHLLQQHRQTVLVQASGCDKAGQFDVTGKVYKLNSGSNQYVFEFQKAYSGWTWVQWGLLEGRILEGYWGYHRGDERGHARYEKVVAVADTEETSLDSEQGLDDWKALTMHAHG